MNAVSTAVSTAVSAPTALPRDLAALAELLVGWLETGDRPDGLFADDVFADLSLPQWRLQATGAEAAFGLREAGHPWPGQVRVESVESTSRGFLVQFEERWSSDGQQWYCRELIHCIVANRRISELAIYCTGDWDEPTQHRHADQVRLIRP